MKSKSKEETITRPNRVTITVIMYRVAHGRREWWTVEVRRNNVTIHQDSNITADRKADATYARHINAARRGDYDNKKAR